MVEIKDKNYVRNCSYINEKRKDLKSDLSFSMVQKSSLLFATRPERKSD